MQIHGATVVTMPDGSEKTGLVRRLVDDEGWFPMTCLDPASASQIANPFGPAGYKTIWYEVVSELGRVPDTVFVPVGGGDCLTGIWRGALEWRELGLASTVPRLVGCQSSAAAPLVEAVGDGTGEIREVAELPTRALSIRHGRCSPTALEAVRDSGGGAVAISDRELLDAIKLVARCGLLPEAASATTIAAAVKMVGSGEHVGGTVVCVVTGSAAKWSDLMEELAGVEGGAAVRNEGEGRGRNRQAQRMTRLGAVHD
jgi:threonine synthase